MQQTVAARHEFYERTEVQYGTYCAVVNLSFFRLCHDGFDLGQSCVDAGLVLGGDFHVAQARVLVFVYADGGACLLLDALDHLTLRADYGADHLLRNVERNQTRNMRLVVLTGFGYGVVYDVQDVQTTFAGLVQRLFENFIAQTVALDVHLSGRDSFFSTGHLEVHVTEMILVAEDIAQDGVFDVARVGYQAHCHACHRTFHLYSGVKQRQSAAADSGHG